MKIVFDFILDTFVGRVEKQKPMIKKKGQSKDELLEYFEILGAQVREGRESGRGVWES